MVKINKTKKVVKKKTTKSKTTKKTKALAQKKAQPRTEIALFQKRPTRRIKDPVAYFGCMKECCQAGIRPKKITEIAHECKTNSLVSKKFSTQKLKDLKKLGSSFNKFQ